MIILMTRMIADGAIILDPPPRNEPPVKYVFFRTGSTTNIFPGGKAAGRVIVSS